MATISFPPTIGPDRVRELADEYRRLETQLAEARRAVKEAERHRDHALQDDGRAYAEAIRAGKTKPTRKPVTDAEQALIDARRTVDALGQALAACEGDLETAVDEVRLEWLKDLEDEHEQRRQQFEQAVDRLAEAHSELQRTRATAEWARHFAAHTSGATRVLYKPQPGVLTTWRLPNGNHPSTLETIAALRELARPTVNRQPAPFTSRTPLTQVTR